MRTQHPVRSMRKQRGLVAVIVTIALFAFIGVAALAIDINHALMNRTKLQSSVDAAALAAAVILDSYGTDAEAKAAATTVLTRMSSSSGNGELDFVAPVSVDFTFSNRPDFSGSYDASLKERYVRVSVANMPLSSFFMQIFGIDKSLSGSAVAGPSTGGGTCNAVPMAVCAADVNDDADAGYSPKNVYALKMAKNISEMGAGNFQLVDYESDDKLAQQLAGGYKGCVSDDGTITSKPGNTVGQVGVGINTRFGEYPNGNSGGGLDATSYPSDTNVTEATISAAEKTTVLAGGSVNTSSFNINYDSYKPTGNLRRVVAVPIIDCSSNETGKSDYEVVTVGCFFILKKAPTNNGNADPVFGEYIEDCTTKNTMNNGESQSSGTHRIVLYDDPYNEES